MCVVNQCCEVCCEIHVMMFVFFGVKRRCTFFCINTTLVKDALPVSLCENQAVLAIALQGLHYFKGQVRFKIGFF